MAYTDYKSLLSHPCSTVHIQTAHKEASSMDRPELIGARLRQLRLALGFPHARHFAEFVGISEQAWNHFETGRRAPTPPDATKVAAKTGITLDWIYRGLTGAMPLHVMQKLDALPEEHPISVQKRSGARH